MVQPVRADSAGPTAVAAHTAASDPVKRYSVTYRPNSTISSRYREERLVSNQFRRGIELLVRLDSPPHGRNGRHNGGAGSRGRPNRGTRRRIQVLSVVNATYPRSWGSETTTVEVHRDICKSVVDGAVQTVRWRAWRQPARVGSVEPTGDPDCTEETDVDAVVLGTPCQHGPDRFPRGSLTVVLVRSTVVPVLTVRTANAE